MEYNRVPQNEENHLDSGFKQIIGHSPALKSVLVEVERVALTDSTKQLPEAPGKEIEVTTVNYASGAVDAIHRHDAHAVVYVLEGEVEMQVRGGMLQRLGPGQVFYESPEDVHTVSGNASKTKSAKFVVFFIKNEGAPILTPVH